jgi:ribosomal protein S18 acetylase RimI-like enzyme
MAHQPNHQTFSISPVRNTTDLADTIALFHAYAASLGFDLAFQNFSAEMAGMPGKYAPAAGGELLLARNTASGKAIGCVGLRSLTPSSSLDGDSAAGNPRRCCEMKRLYVTPDGRGTGVGKALAIGTLDVAEDMGYAEVRLDTLPSMVAALRMYRAFGFEEIDAYYDTPMEGTHFLSLRLPRVKS